MATTLLPASVHQAAFTALNGRRPHYVRRPVVSVWPLRSALLISLLLTGCARFSSRSDIRSLDRVYRVQARQSLYARDAQGRVTRMLLERPAQAALYEDNDTLFVDFVGSSLPEPDNRARTIDRADSAKTLFYHYNRRLDYVAEKSPWFYYQLTSFDVDLFAIPFKYRFATAGRAPELATDANLGVYVGVRYDLGRYRNVYYRRERRSDIQSFSFGAGLVGSIDPVLVTPFNTAGRLNDEYQALGVNYGVATIVGYKSLTAGLALGVEHLADRNDRIWVYSGKPWLGLTIGININ